MSLVTVISGGDAAHFATLVAACIVSQPGLTRLSSAGGVPPASVVAVGPARSRELGCSNWCELRQNGGGFMAAAGFNADCDRTLIAYHGFDGSLPGRLVDLERALKGYERPADLSKEYEVRALSAVPRGKSTPH
jgi:hypothetical protein